MPVTVVPWSEAWPALFADEAAVLDEALRPWAVGGVEHIGSTAVPGLAAKPVLDLMAGVVDLERARAAVPVLEGLGYRQAEHRPAEALWFFRQDGDDYATRTAQLHLTVPGSDLWRERLAFRDALRADAAVREEYQALKQRLAAEADDLGTYNRGKRALIVRVLREAGIDLEPG